LLFQGEIGSCAKFNHCPFSSQDPSLYHLPFVIPFIQIIHEVIGKWIIGEHLIPLPVYKPDRFPEIFTIHPYQETPEPDTLLEQDHGLYFLGHGIVGKFRLKLQKVYRRINPNIPEILSSNILILLYFLMETS
jgi:hypothetical protein